MIFTKKDIDKVIIDNLIKDKITSRKIGELLLIVPTNRKARTLKKEIISQMPNNAADNLNVETLGTLSTKLLKHKQPFSQLSEALSVVFIRQSAIEIKARYLLHYRGDIPFGTLEKIKNVISEYKRHGITPNTIRDESTKLGLAEQNKALDIADIYENYLLKCEKVKAYEIGDIYKKLLELEKNEFDSIFKFLFPDINLIIITGFDEYVRPEIKILDKLSNVNSTILYIDFDYNVKNIHLFGHLESCLRNLEHVGFNSIHLRNDKTKDKFRKIIRENLFKPNVKHFKSFDYSERIKILNGFSRESEIELISKEIKILLSEKRTEPSKICIAFNQIQNYSTIIRDVFEKNGIPFNLTDRIKLDTLAPVTSIINFLEVAESDYYYKNIFRALSSGYFNTGEVNYSNLYAVASELKIVSGKSNWRDSISEAIFTLKNSLDDEFEDKNLKIKSYQKALDDFISIEKLLLPFSGKMSLSSFRENLFDFINSSKIIKKFLEIEGKQEENVRGFSFFIETFNELFDLLIEEKGNNEQFRLNFILDQIRTACSWARFNVKEKSNYGIQITTLEEIRGLKFDYLFIGGLCDGELPSRYRPEIFFSGKFKKHSNTHLLEERNRFYQALSTWEKGLYLTYPRTENGRELVVSSFLNAVEDLFEIKNYNESHYKPYINSKEELEVLFGTQEICQTEFSNYFKSMSSSINIELIEKAILIEKDRSQMTGQESEYNGFIDTSQFINTSYELNNLFNNLLTKQYSISQLELYAKCPFKYFIEKVLGLSIMEEPSEEIEAIEMGRILHVILFEFYTTLREKKIHLNSCSEIEYQDAKKIIFEIAHKIVNVSHFKSPLTFYDREKLFGIDGNLEESILYKFLEHERQTNEFVPSFFEINFGSLKKDGSDQILSSELPIETDGIKLRGKIDRIDICESNSSYDIIDYKSTGTKPTAKQLKNGTSLQLPIYLFAAGELLKRKFNKEFYPNEMFIYSLKFAEGDFLKKEVSIKRDIDVKSNLELIQVSLNNAKKFIDEISNGKFGLSPHEDRDKIVCKNCQFHSVCRVKLKI
jgi:ATP-dependent helicase/nuclease subunit B